MAIYVFSKKVDAVLIQAGGKKEETTQWISKSEWVDYESSYLREFCGDGYWTDKTKRVQKRFFTFIGGSVVIECLGVGKAKISSIVGDEMEVSTRELVTSIQDLLDLFDTAELRAALEAKELEAKADKEAEEREVKRKERQKKKEEIQPLAEQAFQLLYSGKKVAYEVSGGKVVDVSWGWDRSMRKKTLSLSKASLLYTESVTFDINEVVEFADIRKGFLSVDSTKWFPEGLEDLKGFYEYIIAH